MSVVDLRLENFRSIKRQQIQLAPITVVYGPNGSGKSSLLYGPLVLRNIAVSPNQPMASLFNLGFLNMGGLRETAYNRRDDAIVRLGISSPINIPFPDSKCHFQVDLVRQNSIVFGFQIFTPDGSLEADLKLETSLPYALGQQVELDSPNFGWPLSWNGLNWIQRGPALTDHARPVQEVLAELNRPVERLRRISIAPVIRGFFQPQYSMVSPVPPFRENELASLLASDSDLEGNVSLHLEEICGREFRVRIQPGTSVFTLQVLDKKRRLPTELVNDGFGVNQLVYILALALRKETEVMLIEEPEIHLHPSMIRRFAEALVRMARDGKIFLLSTHSEAFVSSLLALVGRGQIPASDVGCYLAERNADDIETRFVRQEINEHGQIDGGLQNFLHSELEDLKALLKSREQ